MIDGSEKRKRQLAFELQNSHVCEKRSKVPISWGDANVSKQTWRKVKWNVSASFKQSGKFLKLFVHEKTHQLIVIIFKVVLDLFPKQSYT